jgi:hypothetical protein
MKYIFILLNVLIFNSFTIAQNSNIVKHNLSVEINPQTSSVSVTDKMEFKGEFEKVFLLNSKLTPTIITKGAKLKKVDNTSKAQDVGMDRDVSSDKSDVILTKWIIKSKSQNIAISYKGIIKEELESNDANYQRGFSETSGIISDIGVYLAGSTYWVPVFEGALMTFKLETKLPKGWKNVTQGKRTFEEVQGDSHIDIWECNKPQEEVFLIAAKFTEYSHKMNSGIDAMAFLRTPDEGIANKYLEVTEQYMEMYQSMLGNYPYSKFALVENFWETGYGMPSFTLLGEKIIRFPFILHSSYPHELLHNWWGNSVYVDFKSGNWCEGTTAFMADHLIKEQRGAGEEYRRSTLQKFSDYVTPENDFPLSEFIARHDGPSEAIGYGKALMMWQMLRRKLGDENFIKGMKLFYDNNIYKTASYSDIRIAMEKVSGIDLKAFFTQWVNRKSAPELAIKSIKTDTYSGKYRINIDIEQVQKEEAFDIDIPINIATEKGIETFVFNMNSKLQSFQISLDSKPLKLAIDPQYDVFRILNPNEVPPTLNKIWGSKINMIILPSKAEKIQLDIYKELAKQWTTADNDSFIVVMDKDISKLPETQTAWIFGYENTFATVVNNKLSAYNSSFTTDSIIFDGKKINKKNDVILTIPNSNDANRQNIFIATSNPKAIPGLVRKLPHYGKYSYLAFNGDEPTNIAKGQWPVLNSPLVKIFNPKASQISLIEERKALAEFKPLFSGSRMMKSIEFLASEELKGRGLGTPELDKASEYIADNFKKAGLKPLSDSYYQEFKHNFKDKGELKVVNVIGIIEGTDENLKDNPIVISAHYDHLGLGWPDVHNGDKGKIHYGADDNASGVAILLELAKTMGKSVKSKRTIVFLACSGEEAGLIGSRYFVAHSKDYFKGQIFADVNIDTDGSLFDKKLMVLNANTAREWKFIFMGTDYTTGVKTEVIEKELDASDQFAFIEKGIPAVQLFTGATANYHRPSDTYDKIDAKGMVKVATVAKEVAVYLADRENPMPYTGANHKAAATTSSTPKTSRRVSTGTVPDFAFQGEGVKVGSVVPNSAGEKAGLKAGDIIIMLDNDKTPNLKIYSDLLKKHQPGDIVKLTILRDKNEKVISLKLGER